MPLLERPAPGSVIELAIWLTGEETDDILRRFKQEDMPREFKAMSERWNILLGPLLFTVKHPGEDRVPQVPPHISGIDVKLLVVEADVLMWRRPQTPGPGFVADLRSDDLQILRRVTRRQHAIAHPGMPPLPDVNCDAVIEEMGPDAAVAELRRSNQASLH